MYFQLLSLVKVILVAKIMYSVHFKHKKLPFLAVLSCFRILTKIKYASQEGDHSW